MRAVVEEADIEGKVCVVTGSNSGIGKATALKLATLGAEVVMVCRNRRRGEAAREDIKRMSGNESVELVVADLSSQRSIREFADSFGKSRHDGPHVLINNAANFDITIKRSTLTEEGIEVIFATNHLGPFLMTNLLLEALKATAPSRIVNVASKGLIVYPRLTIEFDDLNGAKRRKFSPAHAYYHSKLAQVMFTYELARRLEGTGVSVNCIRVPNVKIEKRRYTRLPRHLRSVYRLKRSLGITPDQMAEAYVHLAASPALDGVSGKYFDQRMREVRSSKNSYDKTVWQRLWQVSSELTGLSPN